MKTWRGEDLPPTINDETLAWMTEAAATGKMNPARPAKTRQYGDVTAANTPPDDDGTGEESDET